jgi:hypothetical protein
VGDDGGRAPGTSRSWCWDGWTGAAQPRPALLAAQRWPGRSRPPESRTHPRLAEHRRREELKDIDDRVPPELAQLILQFDGSILVDRTWSEVAGWCAAKAANVLDRNLVHELVTGKPAWSRPGTWEPNTVAYHLGRDAPSAERLLFQGPAGRHRRPRWEQARRSGAPAAGGQAQGRDHRRRGGDRSSHPG